MIIRLIRTIVDIGTGIMRIWRLAEPIQSLSTCLIVPFNKCCLVNKIVIISIEDTNAFDGRGIEAPQIGKVFI